VCLRYVRSPYGNVTQHHDNIVSKRILAGALQLLEQSTLIRILLSKREYRFQKDRRLYKTTYNLRLGHMPDLNLR
jgi:hypothetical protein